MSEIVEELRRLEKRVKELKSILFSLQVKTIIFIQRMLTKEKRLYDDIQITGATQTGIGMIVYVPQKNLEEVKAILREHHIDIQIEYSNAVGILVTWEQVQMIDLLG